MKEYLKDVCEHTPAVVPSQIWGLIGVLTMSATDSSTTDSTDLPQTTDIDETELVQYSSIVEICQSGKSIDITTEQSVTINRHEDLQETQIYVSDSNSMMSVTLWVSHAVGGKIEQLCKETDINVCFEVKD